MTSRVPLNSRTDGAYVPRRPQGLDSCSVLGKSHLSWKTCGRSLIWKSRETHPFKTFALQMSCASLMLSASPGWELANDAGGDNPSRINVPPLGLLACSWILKGRKLQQHSKTWLSQHWSYRLRSEPALLGSCQTIWKSEEKLIISNLVPTRAVVWRAKRT